MNTLVRHVDINSTTSAVGCWRVALAAWQVREVLRAKGDLPLTIGGAEGRKLLGHSRRALLGKFVGEMRKGHAVYLFDGVNQWERATMAD